MNSPSIGRLYFVCFLVILCASILGWKLYTLTFIDRGFLQIESQKRTIRTVSVNADRGVILDRNGVSLAKNKVLYSLWVDPTKLCLESSQVKLLARLLGLESKDLNHKLTSSKRFIYLKRQMSLIEVSDFKSLNIDGLNFQKDYARDYLYGDAMSYILGGVNIDNKGLDGIEFMYEDSLKPEIGRKKVTVDVFGRVLNEKEIIKKQKAGKEIHLTIDKDIQLALHHKLEEYAIKAEAESARAILVHVSTGEIHALANYISKDLHNTYVRNSSFTDLFEPGSTFKPIFMSTILDAGYDNSTKVTTGGQQLKVGPMVVKDVSRSDELNLTGILKKSSNVGMTKLALQLDGSRVTDILQKFGIEMPSYIGFPGEQSGYIPKDLKKNKTSKAAASFGYGIKMTLIELIRCYAILANHGRWVDLHLVKSYTQSNAHQVIPSLHADQIVDMLHQVVESGTAKKAKLKGIKVAGKTGTTHMILNGQYNKKKYQSSFIGLAPYPDPKFILAVQMNNPKGKSYYGGEVAAPVFADITKFILSQHYLNQKSA